MEKKFSKKKEFLVCVDSDGCVMDTMNTKHIHCFAPLFVSYFGLEQNHDIALNHWLQVNLFSGTRGINRFAGLTLVLEQLRKKGLYDGAIEPLKRWCEATAELSNQALQRELATTPNALLDQTYQWSQAVNQAISARAEKGAPFLAVPQVLQELRQVADVVVVSSANQEALFEEWNHFGLITYVDALMSQNDGSKADCIARLLKEGYQTEHVLMVGDAPGDLAAAHQNGIKFYPIIVEQEQQSWYDLMEKGIIPMIEKTFSTEAEAKLIETFYSHLGQNAVK